MTTRLRLDVRALGDPAQPSLIGVSGGRDSVALLHALLEAGYRRLIVCHLDHAWRGESAAEAQFVSALAKRHALPFVTERLGACTGEPQSPETAGRHARLAFFARAARAHGTAAVYLAHHADDQVETTLWNLFRGTGVHGLAGMSPVSRHTVEGTELTLLRPLLGTWRAEIDPYVAAHALAYVEDSSNVDTRHTRNRLRHEIIPAIERAMGREVRGPIWRAAEILAAENEFIAAAPELQSPIAEELSVARLRALPLALQRRLLSAWLNRCGVPNISFTDIENTRALIESESPAKINLSAGHHARRRAGVLFVEPPAASERVST